MSTILKFLVEFKDKKYKVFVETDDNPIPFKSISNEIIFQLKQNISLKTHSFEIFDSDFEEYVSILNENQMVPNLSRIRITSEDINCQKNELDVNYFQQRFKDRSLPTSDNMSEYKSNVTTEQSSVDQNWFKDYFFDSTPKSLAKNSPINEKTATETSDSVDLNNDWKVVTKRGSFVAKEKEKPINYLDLPDIEFSPTVFFYTVIVYNENKSLVGIRYHNDVYKPLILLLEFLSKNKNIKDMSKTSRWKTISKELISNGFDGNDWSPARVRKHFLEALSLYEKCLTDCPDFKTCSAINPLFSYFYLSDIHLLLTTEKLEVISQLRQTFGAKSRPSLKPNKSVNLSTVGSDPRWKAIKDWPKIMKFSKMSYQRISTFEVLIKCTETVAHDYGPRYAVDMFWDLVSNGMKSKGFYEFSTSECQRLFCLYVNDVYGLVLTHTSDYKTAKECYSLFELIHSLDLSRYMSEYSYEKIVALRQKFGKKIIKSKVFQ